MKTGPSTTPRLAQAHVWFIREITPKGPVDKGPYSEAKMLEFANDNHLRLDTPIRSPTRTNNRWIRAENAQALREAINRTFAELDYRWRMKQAETSGNKHRLDRPNEAAETDMAGDRSAPPKISIDSRRNQRAPQNVPDAAVDIQRPIIVVRERASTFHPQRVMILLGSIAGMAGTALPWTNIPIIGSVNGLFVGGEPGWGWFVLLSFIPAFLFCFVPDLSKTIGTFCSLIAAIGVIVGALIAIDRILELNGRVNSIPPADPFEAAARLAVNPGIGLYVIIGAAAFVFFVLVAFPASRSN